MTTVNEPSTIEDFLQFNPQTKLWSVFFNDPANLPLEKIQKCFNQYGTIDSIDRFTGIEGKPLCFINFTTEEAAKRCIVQMRSYRFPIHLKRFSFPNNNSNSKKNSSLNDSDHEVHNNNNKNNNRVNGSGGKKRHEAGLLAEDKSLRRKDSLTSLNSKRPTDEDEAEEFTGKSEELNISTSELNTSATELNASSSESNTQSNLLAEDNEEMNSEDNLKDFTDSWKSLEKPSSSATNSSKFDKIQDLPGLIVKPPKISIDEQSIPVMIPVESPVIYYSPGATIIQHVTAQDVIVANIHETCGINFFLSLFAEYEPLCISRIGVIPRINIRYCHAYFCNEQIAEIVEKLYDKYDIHGTELIVVRAKTLALLASNP